MIQLLIVDDEPLVQIGIQSMLDWASLDVHICGTAMNGEVALNIIASAMPDIVLCDIKMPIMTGLELIAICRNQYETLPLFIFLTSYEEFTLVQEALKNQAFDYLIKLDLTPEVLTTTIKKAITKVHQLKEVSFESSAHTSMRFFYDKFMIRLLNNLFLDREQFELQAKELQMTFQSPGYTVAHCTILDTDQLPFQHEKLLGLCMSTVQMVESLVKKHVPCFIGTLDTKHFCIIFPLENCDEKYYQPKLKSALGGAFDMVHNYFSVRLIAGVGSAHADPLAISDAYQEARHMQALTTDLSPIVFFTETQNTLSHHTFNLGILKNTLRMAFESYDSLMFETTLDSLIDLFKTHPGMYLQAIDATCNVLYLTLSLLQVEPVYLDTYFNEENGYRSIYKKTTLEQVVLWNETFKQAICDFLSSQQKNYKNHLALSIADYIDHHITEKLSLTTTASLFGISPNYLSQLFKKAHQIGFNEYIALRKIAFAKKRLLETDMKVYEIADALGFENAFYFSKVFKKVTGQSPRAFVQQHQREAPHV